MDKSKLYFRKMGHEKMDFINLLVTLNPKSLLII
jgi:hypothetical protein